jgi:trans-aconitate methyltransferase
MKLRGRLIQGIIQQFQKPAGPLGSLVGVILATRSSNLQRNAWTVDLLSIEARHRVLELGCGPGVALKAALTRARDGLVVGVDHSEVMLNQATKRNRQAVAERKLILHLGELDNLQMITDSHGRFDRVFSINVLQFLKNRQDALRSLFNATAAGGVLASTYQPRGTNPTREDALRMAEEIHAHATDAGFINLSIAELPLKPVPAICVLAHRPR